MADTIARDLEGAGFTTETAASGPTALARFTATPADVVVTDLRMKGGDGLELLSAIKAADPSVPVVIMTAFGAVESAVEAMQRGAFHYITKPFALDALRALVERAYRERALTRENALLRRTQRASLAAQPLVGQSLAMRQLRSSIAQVADASAAVLISGETGSGKELVARAIHAAGPRAEHPFVAINCAALPETLLDSELFGHVAGAFPGATVDRRGLFVEAENGTVFLDEVGDLPLDVQVKLLRVLQEREFERVGGSETIKVDVRVVSATHRDLEKQIADGTFREDLYYRLNVFPIVLPPLRDRTSDIGVLAEHFVQKYAPGAGKAVRGLDAGAVAALSGYSWPGNVRELENVIERALILTRGSEITAADLEFTRRPNAVAPAAPAAAPPARATDGARPLGERLQEQERTAIVAAIDAAQGNIAHAARALGINRSTLYYRMRKHGLEHLLPMKDTPDPGTG
jgi:DNA-binding NtrC family response regulator